MLDYKKIVECIKKLGINTYVFDYSIYSQYVDAALRAYNGYDAAFHTEKLYNGFGEITYTKSRMNMAKKICEDHASLTVNSNVNIVMPKGVERDYLLGVNESTGLLGCNDFWNVSSKLYELTCALGTGAYEIVVDNMLDMNGDIVATEYSNINLVIHSAERIIPLSWDSNFNIKEVAFIDLYSVKGTTFIDLRIHLLVPDDASLDLSKGINNCNGCLGSEHKKYIIINKKLKCIGSNYEIIFDNDPGVLNSFDTHSDIPWFSCIKLPIVPNFDLYSPLGASVYMNSLDLLHGCDDLFDCLMSEARYGKKLVFMSKNLCERDPSSGTPIAPNDRNKQSFIFTGDSLNGSDATDSLNNLIKEFNPELRIDKIVSGLNTCLNYLSTSCGLGNNYYKYENGGLKTATEVISENSQMYRNIRKNEGAVESCWLKLIKSILYISNLIYGTNYDINVPIQVEFDASIIEDKVSIRERDLKEVQLGIMSIDEYREKYYVDRRDSPEIAEKVEKIADDVE